MDINQNQFTGSVNASGGRGGDGFGVGRGGDGGDGGSVHFVQVGKEFTPEGITIADLKHPHIEYWGMILKTLIGWIPYRKIWPFSQ